MSGRRLQTLQGLRVLNSCGVGTQPPLLADSTRLPRGYLRDAAGYLKKGSAARQVLPGAATQSL